jgi:lipoate-protein ligase B
MILQFFEFMVLLQCVVCFGEFARYVKLFNRSNKLIPYTKALSWQEKLLKNQIELKELTNLSRTTSGSLILLQHEPVYTLGTATMEHSGPFSRFDRNGERLAFETVPVNRAGQATFHGPGQLVMYPILDLVVNFVCFCFFLIFCRTTLETIFINICVIWRRL